MNLRSVHRTVARPLTFSFASVSSSTCGSCSSRIIIIIIMSVDEERRVFDLCSLIDTVGEESLSDSEEDEDELRESDHNTETENDAYSDVSESIDETDTCLDFYIGKDRKTKWCKALPKKSIRSKKHNIVTHLPGVRSSASNAETALDAWQLYFPEHVIDKIVIYTNIYIERQKEKFSRERDARSTSHSEIKALLGLLYLAGVMRSSHQNLENFYCNDGTGIDVFKATMSLKRLRFLLKCIRFDDIRNRNERKISDKVAPIREIFEDFVSACQKHFMVSKYTTIDEMLESFRGRCSFRQYMKSKLARYGIKMFALVDARTFYVSNLEIYAGQQPDGLYNNSNTPSAIVKRMVEPISKTGRNVTMDSWFSSLCLARQLLEEDNLTMVGTIRKNETEIPSTFANPKGKEQYSSIFGFYGNMTLMSYVPEKNKSILLISTMHHDNSINTPRFDKKPEILEFFNLTKGAVGLVDEMKSSYQVSRKSNRWSMAIFFSLLNIAGINCQIIYQYNNNCKTVRRDFLKHLAMDLLKDHIATRSQISTLPITVRETISKVQKQPQSTKTRSREVQGRCAYCSSKKNRKTKQTCNECQTYICREHAHVLCVDCANKPELESDDE